LSLPWPNRAGGPAAMSPGTGSGCFARLVKCLVVCRIGHRI
jgi:hypothetical protein